MSEFEGELARLYNPCFNPFEIATEAERGIDRIEQIKKPFWLRLPSYGENYLIEIEDQLSRFHSVIDDEKFISLAERDVVAKVNKIVIKKLEEKDGNFKCHRNFGK